MLVQCSVVQKFYGHWPYFDLWMYCSIPYLRIYISNVWITTTLLIPLSESHFHYYLNSSCYLFMISKIEMQKSIVDVPGTICKLLNARWQV